VAAGGSGSDARDKTNGLVLRRRQQGRRVGLIVGQQHQGSTMLHFSGD
jgi:hypothetical protein